MQNQEKAKILIVDDDVDFVEATKIALESKGYRVLAAYNPDDGYRMVESEKPDLLILDVLIERGADGFVMARNIRHKMGIKDMPILMLTSLRERTGFDFIGKPEDPKWLPVNEFVDKPLDYPALFEKVERLLKEREGR
jgi:DNA-binding response OmpR family regulator